MYNNEQELYHFGVKGMRWGHRKAVQKSDLRNRYDKAKAEKRNAKKAYNKSFNEAYNRSSNPIPYGMTKKGRAKTNAAWEKAYDDAERSRNAKANYKSVKKERKQALNKAYKDVNKNSSIGYKLATNDAARKKAAKYIVDNNMTMEQAKKKARGEAVRNTALILSAYGAVKVASLYASRKNAPIGITQNKYFDPIDVPYKILN